MSILKRLNLFELVFAVGMIVLSLVILVDSFSIRLGVSYDRIGPRFFPYVVSTGLLISGLMMVIESLRGKGCQLDSPLGKLPMLFLALALVLCVLLFNHLGFIIAVSIQFWLVARAFKSPHPLRDAFIGIVLAVTVYFSFTKGLGLVLPGGILSGFI
jgi:putative tricarboxylic transport membrane protein